MVEVLVVIFVMVIQMMVNSVWDIVKHMIPLVVVTVLAKVMLQQKHQVVVVTVQRKIIQQQPHQVVVVTVH
jgi:hypothetical protein